MQRHSAAEFDSSEVPAESSATHSLPADVPLTAGRLARLLRIIETLQSGHVYNSQELAEL